MGVWFSHHWEGEHFLRNDAAFERGVLRAIEYGDPASYIAMPGAFSLAQGDGILNPKHNVQIFISTPKDPKTGTELYETRVDKIVDLLTGAGKPWEGITVARRGYVKPKDDREMENFGLRANSKVLIEYDNNQEAAEDEEPKANQQAIYRVWLEKQVGLLAQRLPECANADSKCFFRCGNINGTQKLAFKKMHHVRMPTRNGKTEVHAASPQPAQDLPGFQS